MDTSQLAQIVGVIASVEPTLIALIAALATGGPGLTFAVYKWRKTAPEEHDAVVTEAAQRAVDMMDVTLKAAANERKGLIERLDRQNGRIQHLERRVRQLEDHWPSDYPLPDVA